MTPSSSSSASGHSAPFRTRGAPGPGTRARAEDRPGRPDARRGDLGAPDRPQPRQGPWEVPTTGCAAQRRFRDRSGVLRVAGPARYGPRGSGWSAARSWSSGNCATSSYTWGAAATSRASSKPRSASSTTRCPQVSGPGGGGLFRPVRQGRPDGCAELFGVDGTAERVEHVLRWRVFSGPEPVGVGAQHVVAQTAGPGQLRSSVEALPEQRRQRVQHHPRVAPSVALTVGRGGAACATRHHHRCRRCWPASGLRSCWVA